MDGFFVAKLKKFAPGERKALTTSGVPDKDAPEANEASGSADGMEIDDRFVYSSGFQMVPVPVVSIRAKAQVVFRDDIHAARELGSYDCFFRFG